MFMQKLRRDKRGLTLIELICAIAILAIITTTIGGAMIFASNSYRQGSVDTALQQEAQFTVNAIESLIIDATQTVDFAGGVLTITNLDYTYVIKYDAVEQTLRYDQFATDDPDTVVADNELLASHVTSFVVDADDFATSRNVIIEVGLENGNSSFTTNYNVTSRNDASAGDAPEVVARINCESLLVLEPNQIYDLGVNVVGTSDTGFGVSLESPESPDTTAAVIPGGVRITLGATETGGDDAVFRMLISTSATDSEGNPFTKWVTIRVRRTKTVDITAPTAISGNPFKAGTVYSATATPQGTFLEEVVGASYDSNEHAYIDPNTIKWSFSMSDGSDYSEWIEVANGTGTDGNTVNVKLKQDLPTGKAVVLRATAVHSHGDLRGTIWSNKASRQNGAKTQYADVFNEVKIVKTVGDSLFLRGDDFEIPIERTIADIIKEDIEKRGGTYNPDTDTPTGNYTGNHHIRYITIDEGPVYSSKNLGYGGYDYPGFKKMSFQGFDNKKIEFKEADLIDMRYMRTYKLELVYSFIWQAQNTNELRLYPQDFNPETFDPTDPINAHCVYTWIIDPIAIIFGKAQTDGSFPVDLSEQGYAYEGGQAIGTEANPLPLAQSHDTRITYTNIGPGSNWKAGVTYLLSSRPHIYEWSDSSWVYIGTVQMRNEFDNGNRQTGTLIFGTVNRTDMNHEFKRGNKYKMIIGDALRNMDDPTKPIIYDNVSDTYKVPRSTGLLYTPQTDWEDYSIDKGSEASRGVVFFQLQ